MATLATGPKLGRARKRRPDRPSIREICLIGQSGPGPIPGPGEAIDRGGRVYRVESVQDGPTRSYLHLKPGDGGRPGV